MNSQRLLPAAALDGAQAIKASELLQDELPAIRRGQIDETRMAEELDEEADTNPEDDVSSD